MRNCWIIIGIVVISNGLMAQGNGAGGQLSDQAIEQESNISLDSVRLQVNAEDTFYLARMQDVWVYPKMVFKNKKQERFYWKTVRDVKKTLPYAKLLTKEMQVADQQLVLLPDDKARRKWWKQYEKYLFKKYENDFRRMTPSKGTSFAS